MSSAYLCPWCHRDDRNYAAPCPCGWRPGLGDTRPGGKVLAALRAAEARAAELERERDQYMNLHNEAAAELFDVREALGVTTGAVAAAKALRARVAELERSIDSHKQTADQIAKVLIVAADQRAEKFVKRAAELERERDEERDEMADVRTAMGMDLTDCEIQDPVEMAEYLVKRAAELERERDQWQHHAEKLEAKGDTVLRLKGEVAHLESELRQAREKLEAWRHNSVKKGTVMRSQWRTLEGQRDEARHRATREAAGRDALRRALGDVAERLEGIPEQNAALARDAVLAALAEDRRNGGDHG